MITMSKSQLEALLRPACKMATDATGEALLHLPDLHKLTAVDEITVILTGSGPDGQKSTNATHVGCRCFSCFAASMAALAQAFGASMIEEDAAPAETVH